MSHCDLCGKQSERLSRVDNLWGLGVSTMCADPAECHETWSGAFEAPEPFLVEPEPAPEPTGVPGTSTDVIRYWPRFDSLDKAEPGPCRGDTVRL